MQIFKVSYDYFLKIFWNFIIDNLSTKNPYNLHGYCCSRKLKLFLGWILLHNSCLYFKYMVSEN